MGRPEYWHSIMSPNIINHIKQEQEQYDKNPEEYERQKRWEEEQYQQEQEEIVRQMRREQEQKQEYK